MMDAAVGTREGGDEKEGLLEIDCTSEHWYCSVHGVNTLRCIRETNLIGRLDLEVIRQYCWFATTTLDKIDNIKKWNMLFCWYITNTYNICGKGHCKELPA